MIGVRGVHKRRPIWPQQSPEAADPHEQLPSFAPVVERAGDHDDDEIKGGTEHESIIARFVDGNTVEILSEFWAVVRLQVSAHHAFGVDRTTRGAMAFLLGP